MKKYFLFLLLVLSGQLLLSKPNPVPGGVRENCATDFFHSWITPLAGFITTIGTIAVVENKNRLRLCTLFLYLTLSFHSFSASNIYLLHTQGTSANVQGISLCLCTTPLHTGLHWY